jgi:hypothetical protein
VGEAITARDIMEYQSKMGDIKTIGEFKALGRELRDKFNLTDRQAIDILNNRQDEILKILAEQEIGK